MEITVNSTLDAGLASDPGSVRRISQIGDTRERAEAVAGQFESLLMGMMMKAMRATVPEGGMMGEGLGGKTYVEMLDQQLVQMGGLPRDPRFHEALVRQIAGESGVSNGPADAGPDIMNEGGAEPSPGA